MNKIRFSAAVLAALLSAAVPAKTLVTVNSQAIDSSVIDAQVKSLRADNAKLPDSPELRRSLTERQVISTVVAQEAKRLKLDQSAEFKQALEQARASAKQQGADKKAHFKTEWAVFENDLLGRAYAAHVVSQNPVQEKDVKAAYDEFSKFYKGSYEVRLGEIAAKSSEDAQKAIAGLAAKKNFAAVLKQYSADEAAKQAGGIAAEYVPLKDLQQNAPALFNALKDLKKGGHTAAPLPNGGIYSVFYVQDRREVKVPAYEQVKNDIGSDLQGERIDAAVQALLQKAAIVPAK